MRVGPKKVTMNLELVNKNYTTNMGGVDWIDQCSAAAWGFVSEFLWEVVCQSSLGNTRYFGQ